MTPTNALGVWTSLVELHARLLARTARAWYFTEVPKVSKSVGVDVREKANATA